MEFDIFAYEWFSAKSFLLIEPSEAKCIMLELEIFFKNTDFQAVKFYN